SIIVGVSRDGYCECRFARARGRGPTLRFLQRAHPSRALAASSSSPIRSIEREVVVSGRRPSHRKSHVATQRPPFERIALILQGGGALGAYQAGVYQALAEANLHPDWVAVKGAWAGPAAIQLFDHALCDVARLPVREVVSATHYVTDLTL